MIFVSLLNSTTGTGFSPNLSTGINLGLKLPTGAIHEDADLVERDTQLGTGSTDLLLGGFHREVFTKSQAWEWFACSFSCVPMATQVKRIFALDRTEYGSGELITQSWLLPGHAKRSSRWHAAASLFENTRATVARMLILTTQDISVFFYRQVSKLSCAQSPFMLTWNCRCSRTSLEINSPLRSSSSWL